MMTFDLAFTRLIGNEGVLSMDPKDSGNWTGGKIGLGKLKGSKYGISAASYPMVDIANLTLEGAKAIYLRDEIRGGDFTDVVGQSPALARVLERLPRQLKLAVELQQHRLQDEGFGRERGAAAEAIRDRVRRRRIAGTRVTPWPDRGVGGIGHEQQARSRRRQHP